MRIATLTAAAALALGLAASALAQQAMPAEEFAATAASSDMFEIQSSQLALEKSKDESITGFAQMMVNDHTAASEKLKAAAEEAKVEVPAEMMPKHQQQLDSLKGVAEGEFDAAYVQAQVAAHQEALTLMETYAAGGDSEPLKMHAANTAPTIKMHYEHVQKIEGEM